MYLFGRLRPLCLITPKICISVFMSKKRALTSHFILFFCQERRADFNISESLNLERKEVEKAEITTLKL